MKPLHTIIATAILTALTTTSTAALADPAACHTGITGMGRMSSGMAYDPPRHYDAGKIARKKAIADWRTKVAATCPHHSTWWIRASSKAIVCDGYAGGTGCEATAIPR